MPNPPSPAPMNPHFASLVTGLAFQADQALNGSLPPGAGGEAANPREVARTLIDTLGMLEEKMAGHLNPDEQRLLAGALTTLRFRWVTTQGKESRN
jgi:uncharacterized protein DUF1844